MAQQTVDSVFSREQQELMEQFERIYSGRFDKEPRANWTRGIIYQNGETNKMFLIFRQGYSLGKFVEATS